MPRGQWVPLTEYQKEQIKERYLDEPIKAIANDIGTNYNRIMRFLKRNGLEVPPELIRQRQLESRYQKGCISHNKGRKQTEYMTPEAIERSAKTRFKKGDLPHNTNYDGHERITLDGYIEVRVKKGKYRLKHVLNWEKENGKLKKGYCLRCKSDDKQNTNPSNWRLITRGENMKLNSISSLSLGARRITLLKNELLKKIN